MISILMSKADTCAELKRDYDEWLFQFGKPPSIIIAHENLPFDINGIDKFKLKENKNRTTLKYYGIRVISLDDFNTLHEDDLKDEA